MTKRRRRITLKWPSDLALLGEGDDLAFEFDAERDLPKAKRLDSVRVRVELGRGMLNCILLQIREMHERDLARLERHRQRIVAESKKLLRSE